MLSHSMVCDLPARAGPAVDGVGSAIADAVSVPVRGHPEPPPPVRTAEWERAVVTASDLGAEVVEAVARLDLRPPQREGVGPRVIGPGLGADGQFEAALGDEPALAAAEEAGWIAEPVDRPAEA